MAGQSNQYGIEGTHNPVQTKLDEAIAEQRMVVELRVHLWRRGVLMIDPITLGGIFNIGGKLIDKIFPDPAEKAKAQLELLRMQQAGELDEIKTQLSAMLGM